MSATGNAAVIFARALPNTNWIALANRMQRRGLRPRIISVQVSFRSPSIPVPTGGKERRPRTLAGESKTKRVPQRCTRKRAACATIQNVGGRVEGGITRLSPDFRVHRGGLVGQWLKHNPDSPQPISVGVAGKNTFHPRLFPSVDLYQRQAGRAVP